MKNQELLLASLLAMQMSLSENVGLTERFPKCPILYEYFSSKGYWMADIYFDSEKGFGVLQRYPLSSQTKWVATLEEARALIPKEYHYIPTKYGEQLDKEMEA